VSRPYYVERMPIATQIVRHAYVDPSARAPWLVIGSEAALRGPHFLHDREAFAMDLLRTGKVTRKRASHLADVAVREAYTRRLPPALVLGVMLTENDELKSTARSHVGAVGLMQVYPKHWREALAAKFGTNVRTDSTNLKYGIYILGWVAKKAAEATATTTDADWRSALLRYNGCVHGTNTPNCHRYPDVVRRQVEKSAKSTCGGTTFEECVVKPLALGRRPAD
jgi:soluble lytic murein transglycosylase-like protein